MLLPITTPVGSVAAATATPVHRAGSRLSRVTAQLCQSSLKLASMVCAAAVHTAVACDVLELKYEELDRHASAVLVFSK